MKKREILALLEKTVEEHAIKVIYDEILGRGGYCCVENKKYIIINSRLPIEIKISVFLEELTGQGWIALPPEIKELLNQ